MGKETKIQPGAIKTEKSHLRCIKAGWGHKPPKVSVVVLVSDFNTPKLWTTSSICIRKIRTTVPFKDSEIIIIANAPSDRLRSTIYGVEKEDPRVVSIVMNQNLGVVAKNFGYNLAQGEYILSVDGDVYVEPGWVEKFLGAMDKNPSWGLVGPCGGRLRMDAWEPSGWPAGKFEYGFRSAFGYEDAEFFGAKTISGIDGTILDVIPSMCWCFRREILQRVGYLNWRFGPFVGSDADFCFRIKMDSWKVVLVRVPIRHADGGGNTHKFFLDLKGLKANHIKELYDRWFPRRVKVCEYGRMKTPK